MTPKEIERLRWVFEELVSIFEDIRERRGCSKIAKRMDVILAKLGETIFIAQEAQR